MRRLLVGLVTAAAVYLLALFVLGFALGGWVGGRVRDRLAAALDADVTVGDASLSLLRGRIELSDIRVHRDHGGTVDIEIDRIDASVAPLGWVAFDGDVRHAAVDGMRMQVSARGLVDLAERRRRLIPIPVGELSLSRSSIAVMPTSYLPGLGRLELRIARVHTTDFSLRHGLSWVFRMRELDATAEALGVSVGVAYDRESLALSGGLFGSDPIRIAFPLPQPGPDGYELQTILLFAKQLATSLGDELTTEIKDTVTDWLGDLF
jgi:hypothetical protein